MDGLKARRAWARKSRASDCQVGTDSEFGHASAFSMCMKACSSSDFDRPKIAAAHAFDLLDHVHPVRSFIDRLACGTVAADHSGARSTAGVLNAHRRLPLDDGDIRRGGVLHPDDMVAAIHVVHLAGDTRRQVGQQIHPAPTTSSIVAFRCIGEFSWFQRRM